MGGALPLQPHQRMRTIHALRIIFLRVGAEVRNAVAAARAGPFSSFSFHLFTFGGWEDGAEARRTVGEPAAVAQDKSDGHFSIRLRANRTDRLVFVAGIVEDESVVGLVASPIHSVSTGLAHEDRSSISEEGDGWVVLCGVGGWVGGWVGGKRPFE